MNRLVFLIIIVILSACQSSETEDGGKQIDLEKVESVENNQAIIQNKIISEEEEMTTTQGEDTSLINQEGSTVKSRFLLPDGFKRVDIDITSFGQYLRNLPLKPHGSKVTYFDGRIKDRLNVYVAVVDMDVGDRDLQQCADAIMRLRGEYLYHNTMEKDIHFNLTNGFRMDYSKWSLGYRVKVEGNTTSWVKESEASDTYSDFRNYMTFVFVYAGTLSLSDEMTSIPLETMSIGDVFIQGGSPGHGVIVIDMAVNQETGEKIYMLAQSYMPAQDIQVLVNPSSKELSPWYRLKEDATIQTPEWTFTKDDLKRF